MSVEESKVKDVEESKVKEENGSHDNKVETDNLFLKPDFIKPIKKKPAPSELPKLKDENNSDILQDIQEQNSSVNEEVIIKKLKPEKSPSQKLAEKEIPIPYKEPAWGGLPMHKYEFEVIKNGIVIDKVAMNKSFLVVGRSSNCDIIMEHPSISRFHCVIQFRKEDNEHQGLYVYDLGSTHGTFQNKYRLQPKVYNRLKVGHMLKFGLSSRLFILQGPDEDQEPESELTVTELYAQANEKKLKLRSLETLNKDKKDSDLSKSADDNDSTSEGINWGMGEDAVEDEEEEEEAGYNNPFSTNEELFLNDPKKTLRGWYEREGYDLPDYLVEELKPGTFKAKLELPVSSSSGKNILCIVEHKGKKKDAVIQCALEACRILDRQGVLRQATHESHVKKTKKWSENDYYDSDEDEFLDRTGDIERKRKQRMKEHEVSKGMEKVETYDSLKRQYYEVLETLEKLEADLKSVDDLKSEQDSLKSDSSAFSDADELEAYMTHLSSQLPDKHKRIAWKLEAIKLGKEEVRLRKIMNVARPLGVAELPERISLYSDSKSSNSQKPFEKKILKKNISIRKVHNAFLEEEEEIKPKLRKVNVQDDDGDDVVPVPYSKPQRAGSKYDEIMNKERREKFSFTKPLSLERKSVSYKDSESAMEVDKQSLEDSSIESTDLVSVKEVTDVESRISEGEENQPDNSGKKIIGPFLPSADTAIEFSKPIRKEPKKKKLKKEEEKNPFNFEKKYETWVPPSDQTGDGRTSLNDKLGY